jgi:Ca2+-binding EF-hand superfamily protein
MALRLAVFMQQNGLTCKKLVDKLIETKNNSKTNQARNKATSSFISVNFFSKFLKAKVDKSRALDDLLAIVSTSVDMDRDGVISVADLEAFVGRTHFQDFLEKQPLSTAGRARNVHRGGLDTIKKLEDTIRRLSTSSVPREPPVAAKEEQLTMMAEVLPKLRDVLQSRSLTLPQAFALFDHDSLGLLTFPSFSQTLDTLLSISSKAKETLFKKMDRLNIGMVSYADFKKVINADAVGLRLIGNAKDVVEDTFDWEQSMIRTVLEWILTNRFTLSEAFKLLDRDFDGVLTLSDLSKFLQETFGVDP